MTCSVEKVDINGREIAPYEPAAAFSDSGSSRVSIPQDDPAGEGVPVPLLQIVAARKVS